MYEDGPSDWENGPPSDHQYNRREAFHAPATSISLHYAEADNTAATEEQLPPGWAKYFSEDGWPYYYHAERNESSWEVPTTQIEPTGDNFQYEQGSAEYPTGSYAEAALDPEYDASYDLWNGKVPPTEPVYDYSLEYGEEGGATGADFEQADDHVGSESMRLNMENIMQHSARFGNGQPMPPQGMTPYSASSAVTAEEFFSPFSPQSSADTPAAEQGFSSEASPTSRAEASAASALYDEPQGSAGSAHSLELSGSLLLLSPDTTAVAAADPDLAHSGYLGDGANSTSSRSQVFPGLSPSREESQGLRTMHTSVLDDVSQDLAGQVRVRASFAPPVTGTEPARSGALWDGDSYWQQTAPPPADVALSGSLIDTTNASVPNVVSQQEPSPGERRRRMLDALELSPASVHEPAFSFAEVATRPEGFYGPPPTVYTQYTPHAHALLSPSASGMRSGESELFGYLSSSADAEASDRAASPHPASVSSAQSSLVSPRAADVVSAQLVSPRSLPTLAPPVFAAPASAPPFTPYPAVAEAATGSTGGHAVFYSRPSDLDVAALISDDSEEEEPDTDPQQDQPELEWRGETSAGVSPAAQGFYERGEVYYQEEGGYPVYRGPPAEQNADSLYAESYGAGDENTYEGSYAQAPSAGSQAQSNPHEAFAASDGGDGGYGQQAWADTVEEQPSAGATAELSAHEVAWLQYEQLRDSGALPAEEVDATNPELFQHAQYEPGAQAQVQPAAAAGSSKYSRLRSALQGKPKGVPRAAPASVYGAAEGFLEDEFFEALPEDELSTASKRAEWVECVTAQGDVYYYNQVTQHVQWESPFQAQVVPEPSTPAPVTTASVKSDSASGSPVFPSSGASTAAGTTASASVAADAARTSSAAANPAPRRGMVTRNSVSAPASHFAATSVPTTRPVQTALPSSATSSVADQRSASVQKASTEHPVTSQGSYRSHSQDISTGLRHAQPAPAAACGQSGAEEEEQDESGGESTVGSPMAAYSRFAPLGNRASTRSISSLSDNESSEYGFGGSVQGSVQGAFVVNHYAGNQSGPPRSPPIQVYQPPSVNPQWATSEASAAVTKVYTDNADAASQASSESQTHRHLEIWDRFFRNALLVSQSGDAHMDEAQLTRKAVNESIRKIRQKAAMSRSKGATAVARWPHRLVQRRYDALIQFALRKGSATEAGVADSDVSNLSQDERAIVEAGSVAGSVSSIDGTLLSMALLAASLHEDMAAAEELLRNGANPSCVDDLIRTPAHYACRSGQVSFLALLFDHDAELEAADAAGRSPLHTAAIFGRTSAIEFLLGCAVDCNSVDLAGNTPLHLAARAGFADGCRLLLRFGASTMIRNLMGMTALGVAQIMRPQTPALQAVVAVLSGGEVAPALGEVLSTETAKAQPAAFSGDISAQPSNARVEASVRGRDTTTLEHRKRAESRRAEGEHHPGARQVSAPSSGDSAPPVRGAGAAPVGGQMEEEDQLEQEPEQYGADGDDLDGGEDGEGLGEEEEESSVADLVTASVWGVAATLIDMTLSMFSAPAKADTNARKTAGPSPSVSKAPVVSAQGSSWRLFAAPAPVAPPIETPPRVNFSKGPPTDKELLDRGLGFPVAPTRISRGDTAEFEPTGVPIDQRSLSVKPLAPPAIFARELDQHMEALRSSAHSTPSRGGDAGAQYAPPTPPSEVMVAVALNKAEHQRQLSLLKPTHPAASLSLMDDQDTPPARSPAPPPLFHNTSSVRALEGEQQQQAAGGTSPPTSGNGYSLGSSLPRGVTWRYVDVLNGQK